MQILLTEDVVRFSAYMNAIWCGTEGWFDPMAASVCDALLCFQECEMGPLGHVLEIGVWKGKSAGLWAVHLREGEALHMMDITPDRPAIDGVMRAAASIRGGSGEPTVTLVQASSRLIGDQDFYCDAVPGFRWIHIDGNHTGPFVESDLLAADRILMEDGIICLDDFFSPWYPQITRSVFRYLEANPSRLTLFLAGCNKAYLARPATVHHVLDYCAQRLPEDLEARREALGSPHPSGMSQAVLSKTTRPADMNCFGISAAPAGGHSLRRGLDGDVGTLPY